MRRARAREDRWYRGRFALFSERRAGRIFIFRSDYGQDIGRNFTEAAEKFAAAADSHALYEAKTAYLGKTGRVGALYKKLKELPSEVRPAFGAQINELRTAIEARAAAFEQTLREKELTARLAGEQVDVTMPGRRHARGRCTP